MQERNSGKLKSGEWMVKIEGDFKQISLGQGSKKSRSVCLGQANIVHGQERIEVQWQGGQVKLASFLVSLNKNVSLIHVNDCFAQCFSLGSLVFLPPQKPKFLNSNSTRIEDPHGNQLRLI